MKMMWVHNHMLPAAFIKECESFVKELRRHLVASIYNRQYSPKAKYPYKVMSFVNAMSWRVYETAKGALKLINQSLIIPSLCLVRAAWEEMAVTYELSTLVKTCCDNQSITDDIDDTLMRICFANRFEKNNHFVGESHYELFKDYPAKNIITLVGKVEKEFPETKDLYSTICEFVHPNGDGVLGSYSRLDEDSSTTDFGPQIDKNSELFQPFITTLSCAVMLYLRFLESIESSIAEFAKLCEDSLLDNSAEN